jgi:hypothetical protein
MFFRKPQSRQNARMLTVLSAFRRGQIRGLGALRAVELLFLLLAGAGANAQGARVTAEPIPDAVWAYMSGRSWRAELPCPGRDELVLLRVPYLDFDGNAQTELASQN